MFYSKLNARRKVMMILWFYIFFNPIALRTAKTLWSFGLSECNRVNSRRVIIKVALKF